MNQLDKILAMKDTDWVPRGAVAEVCADCAEKMNRKGMSAIRASVIKAALADSEVRNAVKAMKQGDSQVPKLEFTQLPKKED